LLTKCTMAEMVNSIFEFPPNPANSWENNLTYQLNFVVPVPMTAAYNLPNDEDAIAKGGSKLVLIKNVQKSKYAKVLIPISAVAVNREQVSKHLSFDAF